jgi:hypothetical protein
MHEAEIHASRYQRKFFSKITHRVMLFNAETGYLNRAKKFNAILGGSCSKRLL